MVKRRTMMKRPPGAAAVPMTTVNKASRKRRASAAISSAARGGVIKLNEKPKGRKFRWLRRRAGDAETVWSFFFGTIIVVFFFMLLMSDTSRDQHYFSAFVKADVSGGTTFSDMASASDVQTWLTTYVKAMYPSAMTHEMTQLRSKMPSLRTSRGVWRYDLTVARLVFSSTPGDTFANTRVGNTPAGTLSYAPGLSNATNGFQYLTESASMPLQQTQGRLRRTYPDGGWVQELPVASLTALNSDAKANDLLVDHRIAALHTAFDRATARALFVDVCMGFDRDLFTRASLAEAEYSILHCSQFMVEKDQFGGVYPSLSQLNFDTNKLEQEDWFQIVAFVFLPIMVVGELVQIFADRGAYCDPVNLVDIGLIACLSWRTYTYVEFKDKYVAWKTSCGTGVTPWTSKCVYDLQEVLAEYKVCMTMLGFVLFIVFLKGTYAFSQYSDIFRVPMMTLQYSVPGSLGFFLFWIPMVIAFGAMLTCIVGDYITAYQDPLTAFQTLFETIVGNADFSVFTYDRDGIIARIVFISFIFFNAFLVLTMFISIIDSAFQRAKEGDASTEVWERAPLVRLAKYILKSSVHAVDEVIDVLDGDTDEEEDEEGEAEETDETKLHGSGGLVPTPPAGASKKSGGTPEGVARARKYI